MVLEPRVYKPCKRSKEKPNNIKELVQEQANKSSISDKRINVARWFKTAKFWILIGKVMEGEKLIICIAENPIYNNMNH